MQQPVYREISLRPQTAQFFIDELPLLLYCPVGLVYGGMERYHIGSEQLTAEHGVFQRSIGYIELYRVVDFHEQQSLLQQIFGLKTVTVLSMDRTTPKLELTGLPKRINIVDIIRERVEFNKQRKGIYEITNH